MSNIRNVFMTTIAAGLFAGAFFMFSKGPCDEPLTYRIGTLDPKFGVSQATFLADIQAAEAVWESSSTPDLFKYDPHGKLPINLVYDNRQATVDKAKALAQTVGKTIQTADKVKADFESAKAQYESAKVAYDAEVADFEAALAAYNKEVAYWNGKGGATPAEYEKLSGEKASLETERSRANAKMVELNDLARQVNASVDSYNTLIRSANSNVAKINESTDKEFEEGEYISDKDGQRINVYEFDGKQKLIRVLAHEMGHALGIDHNSDPDSIMYYLNNGTGLTPSSADIAAFKAACRLK